MEQKGSAVFCEHIKSFNSIRNVASTYQLQILRLTNESFQMFDSVLQEIGSLAANFAIRSNRATGRQNVKGDKQRN